MIVIVAFFSSCVTVNKDFSVTVANSRIYTSYVLWDGIYNGLYICDGRYTAGAAVRLFHPLARLGNRA